MPFKECWLSRNFAVIGFIEIDTGILAAGVSDKATVAATKEVLKPSSY